LASTLPSASRAAASTSSSAFILGSNHSSTSINSTGSQRRISAHRKAATTNDLLKRQSRQSLTGSDNSWRTGGSESGGSKDSDTEDERDSGSSSCGTSLDGLDQEDKGILVTGFAVASNQRNADFHALFPHIPQDEYLIEGEYMVFLLKDSG